MFGPEFFPTPPAIIGQMYAKIDKSARHFLDPSAGKGDIADHVTDGRRRGRREGEFDCIEQSPELVSILTDKGYPVVGFDWLSYDGVCYYDAILMNPPFSAGADHLLKAWDFLYNGEIVCLLNAETVRNPYTATRQRLAEVIGQHGNVEFLGHCFDTAQRKTDVDVAMVYLKKIAPDDAPELWTVVNAEKESRTDLTPDNAIALRDTLGNMQHYFDMANQHMTEAFRHLRKASVYLSGNSLSIDRFEDAIKAGSQNFNHGKAEFVRKHRKAAWMKVLGRTEFRRWLDHKQAEEMARDLERDSNIPFTAANIKATLENIWQSRQSLFLKSVANVFDELRRYHPGNVHHTEGWESNSSYKVNPRIVFPYGCRFDTTFRSFSMNWGRDIDIYNDLDRILCVLDGRDFSGCHTIGAAMRDAFHTLRSGLKSPFNNQATSQYFDIRFFMKGTVHLMWRRPDLRDAFNKTAAEGRAEIGADSERQKARAA